MPRKKRNDAAQEAVTVPSNASDVATLEPTPKDVDQRESQVGSPSNTEGPTANERKQFRSWVVADDLGYTRLTDEVNGRIVLQFAEKPAAEILAAIKRAGFEFKPNYYGQKNCWVRHNDFEGRLQVENLEKSLKKTGHEQETAVPQF